MHDMISVLLHNSPTVRCRISFTLLRASIVRGVRSSRYHHPASVQWTFSLRKVTLI